MLILEAMQHSIPVITYDEGGIPDIVVDGVNGFICERNNVRQLAQRIESLVEKPILASKMGKEGLKLFEEKFTLNVWESNMVECINKVLSLCD